MKKLITKKLLVFLILSLPYAAKADVLKKKAFLANHLVDERLQAKLDEHSDLLTNLVKEIDETPYQKHGVWQFDWLPGYYVKYNVVRVFMSERLSRCISQYELNRLYVPQKQLCHIKGRPQSLDNLNYVVVIKELQADPTQESKPMDLEHVKQFIILIEKTGHCSTFAHNYLRLNDGKIAFVDTDGTFNKKNPIRGIIDLLHRDLEGYYTPKALYYIIDRIATRLSQLYGQERCSAEKRIAKFLGEQEPELSTKIQRLLKLRIKKYA